MLTIHVTEVSEIYGHGRRLVIWFSGCTIRCKGCMNEHLWERSSGTEYSVPEVVDMIRSSPGIVGVTYIGGEPLDQDTILEELSHEIIQSGLDIVLFTGYDVNEFNEFQKRVADMSCVIISGRYIESMRNTFLSHRGSSNQKVSVKQETLLPYYSDETRKVEITITKESVKYLGFPEDFVYY